MYLSSLRSQLFNQILSLRISLGYWQQPLDGDVYMLHGSRSIFTDKLDDTLRQRHRCMDIATTASLYGSGRSLLSGKPLEIEQKVFADNREITRCLDDNGLKLQMRALRVTAEDLNYDYNAASKMLELKLRLPTGSYLTSLLDHFVTTSDAH
jgi:tRNA pseudouridine13 synthase